MTSIRVKRALLASACSFLLAHAVAAQEGTDPAPKDEPVTEAPDAPPPPEGDADEVVIVTATQRARALQDVPVAVTALGTAQIENAGITDIKTLTALVPSLAVPVTESFASVTARIRGVGTQGSNPGLESAVGVFIDGVYRSRNAVALTDLGEIERVEVLRGPQGTLFGRNTSAGLINVTTRAPDFFTEIDAALTLGSFNEVSLEAMFNAPISDRAAFRIAAARRTRDGWADVNADAPFGQREGHDRDYYTMRGQLLVEFSPETSLRVIADHTYRDEECCYAATLRAGGPGRAGGSAPHVVVNNLILGFTGMSGTNEIGSQEVYANRTYDNEITDSGLSAELTSDIFGGTLTSITAFRDWDFANGNDNDFSMADILGTPDGAQATEFKTFTHEMRFNRTFGRVDVLAGLYYANETLDRRAATGVGADHEAFISLYRFGPTALSHRQLLNTLYGHSLAVPVSSGGGGTRDVYEQVSRNFALFTHNVINVTDAFEITLGLRFTREEKEFRGSYSTFGNGGCLTVESVYGLDPGALAPAPERLLAALTCLPWQRTALDGLDHRQHKVENEWSGIATLSYAFSDDVFGYATFSRGYKAGGFNLDRAFTDLSGPGGAPRSIVSGPVGAQTVRGPDTSFAPEIVDSYELGLKTEWFDGDLTANVALFWQNFTDFQLNTFNGISFVVTSVPEVISRGVEIDAVWRATDDLTFTGGLAWNDAKHGGDLGSLTDNTTFLGQNTNLFFLPGSQLTSAPEWTLTGSATYGWAVYEGWSLLASIDGRWVSDSVTGSNLDPAKTQEAFALFNARLGLETEDGRFGIEGFVTNLFDERYQQIAFDSPLFGSAPSVSNPAGTSHLSAFLGEPRVFGVTGRMRF